MSEIDDESTRASLLEILEPSTNRARSLLREARYSHVAQPIRKHHVDGCVVSDLVANDPEAEDPVAAKNAQRNRSACLPPDVRDDILEAHALVELAIHRNDLVAS